MTPFEIVQRRKRQKAQKGNASMEVAPGVSYNPIVAELAADDALMNVEKRPLSQDLTEAVGNIDIPEEQTPGQELGETPPPSQEDIALAGLGKDTLAPKLTEAVAAVGSPKQVELEAAGEPTKSQAPVPPPQPKGELPPIQAQQPTAQPTEAKQADEVAPEDTGEENDLNWKLRINNLIGGLVRANNIGAGLGPQEPDQFSKTREAIMRRLAQIPIEKRQAVLDLAAQKQRAFENANAVRNQDRMDQQQRRIEMDANAKRELDDPNSERSKAMQELVKRQGGDATGMSANQIIDSRMLSDISSDRRQQTAIDKDIKLQEMRDASAKERLLMKRRGGGSGGTSGISAEEMRKVLIEKGGMDPEATKALPLKVLQAAYLAWFKKNGSEGGGLGVDVNRDEKVRNLKSQYDAFSVGVDNLDKLLPKSGDIPGKEFWTNFLPKKDLVLKGMESLGGSEWAKKANEIQQNAAIAAQKMLAADSGKVVTNEERKILFGLFGIDMETGNVRSDVSPEQFRRGFDLMKQFQDRIRRNLEDAYGKDLDRLKKQGDEYRARHAKDSGQVSAPATVNIRNKVTGEVVPIPANKASKFLADKDFEEVK